MIDAINDRITRLQTVVTRATLVPLLVRAGVFAALLVAIGVAFPPALLLSQYGLPLLLVALLPAVAPRGFLTTLAIVGIVAGWVLVTAQSEDRIELWRLLALASALYLAHSAAALAAALPYDAVVAPEVLARWVTRALVVVLASAVAGVLLVAFAGVGGDSTLLAAAFAGLAVAVAVAALLGWLVRRRA